MVRPTAGSDQNLESDGIEAIQLPPHSPNLNAYAERSIGSLRGECLDQLILFGQASLAVLREHVAHSQRERNHQGLDNLIPFPDERFGKLTGPITKEARLGGLLQYDYREAA